MQRSRCTDTRVSRICSLPTGASNVELNVYRKGRLCVARSAGAQSDNYNFASYSLIITRIIFG